MFPDWDYRKKITITGQTGAGTDYQVKLLITATTGGDFNLDGNSANFPAAKNDGGDLRFSNNAQDTELSFWVESVVSGVATVWVKVGENLDTDKDIYVYYGNSGATNGSDGEDTFILFDDFDSATLDAAKWVYGTISGTTIAKNTAYDISSSVFSQDRIGNTYDFFTTADTINPLGGGRACIIGESRLASTNHGTHLIGLYIVKDADTTISYDTPRMVLATAWNYGGNRVRTRKGNSGGSTWSGLVSGSFVNNRRHVQMKMRPNGVWSVEVDASEIYSDSGYTTDTYGTFRNQRYGSGSNGNNEWDYIAVRKLANTEPDFSSVSTEEANTAGSAAQAARRGAVMMM